MRPTPPKTSERADTVRWRRRVVLLALLGCGGLVGLVALIATSLWGRRETAGSATLPEGRLGPRHPAPRTRAGSPSDAADIVHLLAVGDTGEGNDTQYRVAAQMAATCRMLPCDGVLLLGDNFYPNGVTSAADPQWLSKFERPYAAPALNVPFYAVLGNHDTGLTSTGGADAELAYARLPLGVGPGTRPSRRWQMPARYYDVRLRHVHLFALDTQDYSAAQRTQMAQRVRASDAPWKLVFGHHPRYSSGRHQEQLEWLAMLGLAELLDETLCAGAALYLAGHDHQLEVIDPEQGQACHGPYFVISGAGSMPRASRQPAVEHQLYFEAARGGFVELTATPARLDLAVVLDGGERSYRLGLKTPAQRAWRGAAPTLLRSRDPRQDSSGSPRPGSAR